jgi:hypothetical protein
MGNRGQVNYAAAKGALNSATRALALEVATRGITVNAVAPGIIATGMTDNMFDDETIARLVPNEARRSPRGSRSIGGVSRFGRGRLRHRTGNINQRRHDLMAAPSVASALSVHKSETLLFFTLLELAVIIGVARLGAALAQRLGQAAVIGEIVGGILLGPVAVWLGRPAGIQFRLPLGSAVEPLQMLSGSRAGAGDVSNRARI